MVLLIGGAMFAIDITKRGQQLKNIVFMNYQCIQDSNPEILQAIAIIEPDFTGKKS